MFLYPALTIGFALVAVPPLVHLINLLRHRQTQWAAMDFLLIAYRRQRRWIVLRQMLLLATRIALTAVLVAALAGWIGGGGWAAAVGGASGHTIVLLDDSYSMGQRIGESGTAHDAAMTNLRRLVESLRTAAGQQRLTVLRASAARLVGGENETADAVGDLVAEIVNEQTELPPGLSAAGPSSLRVDLTAASDLVAELIDAVPADQTDVLILSDFAAIDWGRGGPIAAAAQSWESAGARVRLVDCGGTNPQPANLAVTALRPQPGVWVAGVPVVFDLEIANRSATAAGDITVDIEVATYGDSVTTADPTRSVSGVTSSQPAVTIDQIAAGATVKRSFQVFIPSAGRHVVTASLGGGDSLSIDNSRSAALPLTGPQSVLIVDGDAESTGAYHVASVLDPGSQVALGAVPETRDVSMLQDLRADQLTAYRAVILIDVPEINPAAAAVLQNYVRRGGGLMVWLGESTIASSWNASGLLPGRVGEPIETAPGESKITTGPAAEQLGPVAAIGNALFSVLEVRRGWAIEPNDAIDVDRWIEFADSRPLATRHRIGAGSIVTVATGLTPAETNWTGDPSFVVLVLQAAAELFAGNLPPTVRTVTDPLVVPVPPPTYADVATFLPPSGDPPRVAVELTRTSGESEIRLLPDAIPAGGDAGLSLADLTTPGIGEWQRQLAGGATDVYPVATVLVPGESDLRPATHAEVLQSLGTADAEFIQLQDLQSRIATAGGPWQLGLIALLAGLLVAEQYLAAWASHHSPRKATS